MRVIADLHIHSKYSRACSPDLVLEKIAETCSIKGINVVATGDFTHPVWFKEMREKLVEKEDGLYSLRSNVKGQMSNGRFICSTELPCIYTRDGKCRRLHVVVLAPNLETVAKINKSLEKVGCNLKSDGRPILGMDVRKLAEICFNANEKCMLIPAHIWTPWFAMFGSKSGFDSIEECWGEYSKNIYAIETGLSSDPPMNWRVKNLDQMTILSNSDAHSLPNLGREANIFEVDEKKLSYDKLCRIIKDKNKKEFLYTIEFYPEEGMYHIDGHRDCNFSCTPKESARLKNICPVCKKPLVIGVMNRVEELAEKNRDENYVDNSRPPFKKLIELDKIIAEALGIKSRKSKRVQAEYKNLIEKVGTEFDILLNKDLNEIAKNTLPEIVEGIKRVREGNLKIIPGFDGQYGQIKIFSEEDRKNFQKSLF
jgi:uncharacterized protein (TIGR00375 family)